MSSLKIRYIRLREQADGSYQPRLVHGPRERALGFVDRDLRHPTGKWYDLGECKALSDEHAIKIAEKRPATIELLAPASDAAPFVPPLPSVITISTPKPGSVEALVRDYMRDPKVRASVSKKSFDSYTNWMTPLLYTPETKNAQTLRKRAEKAALLAGTAAPERERSSFSQRMVRALEKPEITAFFHHVWDERTLSMANAAITIMSNAWQWGTNDVDWRLKPWPCAREKWPQPDGRVRKIPLPVFLAIVKAADALGLFSVGDGAFLGLFTGQRQTDRLRLADEVKDGRHIIIQSKTGEEVKIKEAPALTRRLGEARLRNAALQLKFGWRMEAIIINERTGKPFEGTAYWENFNKARALAAKGSNELGLHPCPEAADYRDQDLRDTCVVNLREAKVSLDDICEITGHSRNSAALIIKHYMGRDPSRADHAIDALAAHLAAQGLG